MEKIAFKGIDLTAMQKDVKLLVHHIKILDREVAILKREKEERKKAQNQKNEGVPEFLRGFVDGNAGRNQ